jgi:hypothetical protein
MSVTSGWAWGDATPEEYSEQARLCKSTDHAEGFRTFQEKREPKLTGEWACQDRRNPAVNFRSASCWPQRSRPVYLRPWQMRSSGRRPGQ